MKSLPVFAIGTLQGPPFIATIGGVIQLGRSTTLQCADMSTASETVTVDWTTTAVSANISNQTVKSFFLFLVNFFIWPMLIPGIVVCIHVLLLMLT